MPTLIHLELDRDDARIAGLLLRHIADELDGSLAAARITPAQRGNRAFRADQARRISRDLLVAARAATASEELICG